jgi:hypothetical protein
MIDSNSGDYQVQVRMSASMAMLKLRAFVQDLGGTIVDGLVPRPGVIHARLRAGGKSAQPWAIPGSNSWSGANAGTNTKAAPSVLDLDMELRVQQADPKQPYALAIALTLRTARNAWAVPLREIKERHEKILRDLKAYLQATTTSPGDFIPRPY